MMQVWPGLGEAPVPSLMSMICKPEAVVMGFPVCALARVAIAAATPPSMVERMVRREDRICCYLFLPRWRLSNPEAARFQSRFSGRHCHNIAIQREITQ